MIYSAIINIRKRKTVENEHLDKIIFHYSCNFDTEKFISSIYLTWYHNMELS